MEAYIVVSKAILEILVLLKRTHLSSIFTNRETKRASISQGTAMRMRRQFARNTTTPKKTDHREYLNIFISSLRVELFREAFKKHSDNSSPSPFVCFVSTPAEALKKDIKAWDRLKRTVKGHEGTKAWPKTRRRRNTFEASWDNEEVHFKVRTHTKEGLPIDLSGAMIHVAVFDGKSDGKLVGTFSFNLAHLISQSRQQAERGKTRNEPQPQKPSRSGSSQSGFGSNFFNMLYRVDSIRSGQSPVQSSETSKQLQRGEWSTKDNLTTTSDSRENQVLPEEGSDSLQGDTEMISRKSDDADSLALDSEQTRKERRDRNNNKNGTMPNEFRTENKSRSEENDEEQGEMTSGPSAQLLRRVTRSWLGLVQSSELRRSSLESMNVYSVKLNRPLRKVGLHVGTIKFTVDAWWLSDQDADEKIKERQDENKINE